MNRAEITKLIEQNQQSITEQISSMSKTNSDTIEKILTQSLKRHSRNRTRFKPTQSKDQKNVEFRIKKANDSKNVRSEISDNNNVPLGMNLI
jgi:hypothetical protein